MTREEIVADSLRDMTPTRYFNKPGASLDEYFRAWQRCRMISRGASPSGDFAYGVAGGLLRDLIAGGELRRRNRKRCMLIDGWRIIQGDMDMITQSGRRSGEALLPLLADRVGRAATQGVVTDWESINHDEEATRIVDGQISGVTRIEAGQISSSGRPNETGLIVFAFRRPTKAGIGVKSTITLRRYDLQSRDLSRINEHEPEDLYNKVIFSSIDNQSQYEVLVIPVKEGWYVIDSALPWEDERYSGFGDNCLGAPLFHATAGSVIYGGDFLPVKGVALENGSKFKGVLWANHIADAKMALLSQRPDLASKLQQADWKNGATYRCGGPYFDQFALPGVGSLKRSTSPN